jgi:hypothetical protein
MFKAIPPSFIVRTYLRPGVLAVEKVAFSAKFGEDFP